MKRLTEITTIGIVCVFLCFLAQLLPASTGFALVQPSRRGMATTYTSPVYVNRVDHSTILRNGKNPSLHPARSATTTTLSMATTDGDNNKTKSNLPFWLDPGTRGGAVFLSFVLFLLPLIAYSVVTSVFGVDEVEAGKWIGAGFTATASLLWVGTYIFRVATKDMTYVSIECCGRHRRSCKRRMSTHEFDQIKNNTFCDHVVL
jgi:Protein of unknown function (DUF3007)